MQYMLLMAAVPDAPAHEPDLTPPTDWVEEMQRRGVDRGGFRLRPPQEARTVRVQHGETVVVHGPYTEVAEQVAGIGIIDAADLDEALEVAAKHPSARLGAIEVRPLWDV
jgi:hypothetical protein